MRANRLVVLGALSLAWTAHAGTEYRVRGHDVERGGFSGTVTLTDLGGGKTRVERTVTFGDASELALTGVGQRRGRLVRAFLAQSRGAAGVLRREEAGEGLVAFALEEHPDDPLACRTRCTVDGQERARGSGRTDARDPLPLAELEASFDEDADDGVRRVPGFKKAEGGAQGSHMFEGVPFVTGPGDGRAVHPNDPRQGQLGDCYLVAALIAVAKSDPQVIEDAIQSAGGGRYTIRLHKLDWYGGHRDITIDKELPYTLGWQGATSVRLPAFASSSDTESLGGKTLYELWPGLIEKAYAQFEGSYGEIEGGHSSSVFAWLSGKSSTSYETWFMNDDVLVSLLQAAIHKGYPVCVGTNDEDGKVAGRLGVVGDHAYVVWSVDARKKTIQLYNPWATQHPSRALTGEELLSMINRVYVGEF